MAGSREDKTKEAEAAATGKRRWRVSRRGFLISAGVAGASLALGWRYGLPEARLGIADNLEADGAPGSTEGPVTSWFEVRPDNRILIYLPKVEMGQGVHTALAQIAAEELEVPFENLQVVSASTLSGISDGFGTGASNTVSTLFTPLREAAATMREMLRAKAAEKWAVETEAVVAVDGAFFQQTAPDKTMTYAEVVEGVEAWDVPENAPELKAVQDFRYIGAALKRVDFVEKLTGRAVYGYDVRVPGMRYGAVARPPTIGATFLRATAGTAREQPGVVAVVIEDGFAGVVAKTRAQAHAGVAALAVEWQAGAPLQQADIDALVQVGDGGVVIQRVGRTQANLQKGTLLEAHYRSPMAAHAHLEPQAAMVDVKPDKVTAFVSTQSPGLVRDELVKLLGREKDAVEVTATYLGGGFGRRLNVEVAKEAAQLSQAVGAPVHVGWNRTEELRDGYVRPPTHNVMRGSLDEDGTILAVEHVQSSGDVAFPFFPNFLVLLFGADFGAWRGSRVHYDGIKNLQAVSQRAELPVKTGWWRGLGLLCNTFAVESFMDELAHEAGVDALEFRLRHLTDSEHGVRMKAVLNAAAERAGWNAPPPEGHAYGIACSTDVQTVCAQVAEVSIQDGKIRVHKVTAAIDPGLVVNPDGVAAQTQGAIVMGLSSTLFERLTVKDSQFEPSNFDKYPLLTMKETPDIEVIVLESGDEPFGVGEPPLGPVAAAVGNAVFALTGQRLRELPLELKDF
ncbi:molybdopterin-dependent oxidoreductase [soil metagenome]